MEEEEEEGFILTPRTRHASETSVSATIGKDRVLLSDRLVPTLMVESSEISVFCRGQNVTDIPFLII